MDRFRGVVTDLDGTLLRSDGSLFPATVDTLETLRARGLPFVVATARTPRAVRRIAGHEHLGTVVCANGAVVWDAGSDTVLRQTCFDSDALGHAIARLRAALPDVAVGLLSTTQMFLDERSVALRGKGAYDAEPITEYRRHGIIVVAIRHPSLDAEQLMTRATEAFAGAGQPSFANPWTVDVVPAGSTKAVGVAQVMGEAGCPGEETIAIGDMPNDLPLFAWAGWAVAVANAHPLVLEAADEVAPSNDEDGVGWVVRWRLAW